MILDQVSLGARHWIAWAALLAAIGLAALAWSYGRRGTAWPRVLAGFLKAAGILVLGLCLVDPLFTGTRPRPGSNLFLVGADNRASLPLPDHRTRQTLGEPMRERLVQPPRE